MKGTYKVYSYGADSCGDYIKSWTNLDKYAQKFTSLIYAGWLNGYVTGFNLLKPNTFDIMGNTGSDSPYNNCEAILKDTFGTRSL